MNLSKWTIVLIIVFNNIQATEYFVSSLEDSGPGTLREALTLAENGDKITIDAMKISLETPLPPIAKNLHLAIQKGARLFMKDISFEGVELFVEEGGKLIIQGCPQKQKIHLMQGSSATCRIDENEIDHSLVLEGEGELCKKGKGHLRLDQETGENFKGTVFIAEGVLEVENDLEYDVEVAEEGILKGSGAIGKVINRGIVQPGCGKLKLKSSFQQNREGVVRIIINANGHCGSLDVGGTAFLGGKFEILAKEGCYEAGKKYTILNARKLIQGICKVVNKNGLKLALRTSDNALTVEVLESCFVAGKRL